MSRRALCLIRHSLAYRRDAFACGLKAAGYRVLDNVPDARPGDVAILWNRYGHADEIAKRFERAGADVLICENGFLGKNWLGDVWLAIARNHHCGAGKWRVGSPERWDNLNVPLAPFRNEGHEILVLGQRGIGEPGVAAPIRWAEAVTSKHQGKPRWRIRPHPGNEQPKISLEHDLEDALAVATWNSSAALHALMRGVPVWYDFQKWIGGGASKPLDLYGSTEPNLSEQERLAMFRRLVWSQWRLDEIINGEPFRWLLQPEKEAA